MSNYVQTTFFAPKDALLTGNPLKLIKGADVDPEFSAIATAITSKYDATNISSAPVAFNDGTVAAPGITFAAQTNVGFFRIGTSDLGIAVNGVQVVDFKTGVIVGAPTGGDKGAGTVNATGLFVNGTALANSSGANPSAQVGTAAINGAATTFMRSDGAPALNVGISPTWSGTHTFSGNTLSHVIAGKLTIGAPNAGVALTLTGATSQSTIIANGGGTAITFLSVDDTGGYGVNNSASTRVLTTSTVKGWSGSGVNVTDAAIGARGLLNLYGSNSVIATMQISSTAIQGLGPVAAALVDMTPDSGTFTITYTGMTAGVTGTAVWSRNGNQVILFLPAATGTSNATTMTATGIPAAINPTRAQWCGFDAPGENNTIGAQIATRVDTGNTLTFGNGGAPLGVPNAWTNTGTKGIAAGYTVKYLLN